MKKYKNNCDNGNSNVNKHYGQVNKENIPDSIFDLSMDPLDFVKHCNNNENNNSNSVGLKYKLTEFSIDGCLNISQNIKQYINSHFKTPKSKKKINRLLKQQNYLTHKKKYSIFKTKS